MENKSILFKILAALLALYLAVGLASCGKDGLKGDEVDTETEETKRPTLDYSAIDPKEHVKEVTYKGFEIVLDSENADRQELLWRAILDSSTISEYPEESVEYYFLQTKEFYLHAVGYDEEDYLLLLKNRGIDEESMLEDARRMVAKDLIYRYIVDAEGISLTDGERQQLFDKYVEVYVSDYGYDKEYVISSMTEYIYESMLYDKTMELLLTSNTFVLSDATDDN